MSPGPCARVYVACAWLLPLTVAVRGDDRVLVLFQVIKVIAVKSSQPSFPLAVMSGVSVGAWVVVFLSWLFGQHVPSMLRECLQFENCEPMLHQGTICCSDGKRTQATCPKVFFTLPHRNAVPTTHMCRYGVSGGKGRCYKFWTDFMTCMQTRVSVPHLLDVLPCWLIRRTHAGYLSAWALLEQLST